MLPLRVYANLRPSGEYQMPKTSLGTPEFCVGKGIHPLRASVSRLRTGATHAVLETISLGRPWGFVFDQWRGHHGTLALAFACELNEYCPRADRWST